MNPLQDIFISYGRADSYHFAKKLNDCLVAEGLTVWFDFDDIPLGVDYQKQIDDGIDKADNFLFVISPHSVNSPYCALEVERALQQGKRIIPLLHVEAISYATWQTRHPEGTEAEWQEYQAAGKHSSFPNMHPTIQAINWIYVRESDDFAQALHDLLDIYQRQREYVRDHTVFLNHALDWQRHQKETQYLLAGARIQQAHDWLKICFKECQPPCTPIPLQCEYITDSIKNAQNLKTQVFLSYADSDVEGMARVQCFLQRQGLTVWSAHSDIQAGEDCQSALQRGIENADNVVVLLSPEFLSQDDTQAQLTYALTLNKRIIPLWICSSSAIASHSEPSCLIPRQLPPELQTLQAIDLTHTPNPAEWTLETSALLKHIHHDAAYVETHKILLAQALKWERQHHNPCILLRGHTLQHAETWLKTAAKRDRLQPTSLQQKFIQASLQQPPVQALDVFVSYSRTDADLARKLNGALQEQGKHTWFDQESIAPGADFQQEIYRGIEASDNILFVLSPASISSPYCADEVQYAASLNKRFVTVLARDIDTDLLPPELATLQWIDFSHSDTHFSSRFNQLVRTLDTDREYVQDHTKWSQKAIAWHQQQRSDDLLLRGVELAIAEHWYHQSLDENKQPPLTPLQHELITTSREKADAEETLEQQRFKIMQRQLKATVVASAFAIGGLVAIALSGWLSFRHGQKAVTSLATELSHQVSLHVQQNIETAMDRKFSFSRSVAIGAKNGSLDITDMQGLRDYIWGYFQISGGAVSKIYTGTEAGEFVSLATYDDQVMMSVVSEESNFKRVSYDVDSFGNFTTMISTQDYDPRARPWYKAALEGVTASPVYPFKTPLGDYELGISLMEAVKDDAGVMQGVASVDLSLTQLQNVLENIDLETRSHIFILEPSGYLLASSSDTAFLTEGETPQRISALDSQSNVIQQTTQELIDTFGALEQIQAPQALTLDIDDDTLIVRVDTLGAGLGVDWLIVTLIPESEVMKEIHANARMTAILFCSSIVMACILGVYVYRTISLSSRFEAQTSSVKRNLNTTLFLVNSFVQRSASK